MGFILVSTNTDLIDSLKNQAPAYKLIYNMFNVINVENLQFYDTVPCFTSSFLLQEFYTYESS